MPVAIGQFAGSATAFNHGTNPITATATLSGSVAVGDLLLLSIGVTAYGISGNSVSAPTSVSDSLGNVYTQVAWSSASYVTVGGGLYYAISAFAGSSCTLSVTCPTTTGTPFDPAFSVMLEAVAVVGITSAALQAYGTVATTGASAPSTTVSDSNGASVVSTFPLNTQSGFCLVADFSGTAVNFFIAMECWVGGGSPADTPTVSPSTYMIYAPLDNVASTNGNNGPASLTTWTQGVATAPPPPVIRQPQIFVVT